MSNVMKELLRSSDPTIIAFASALLEGEGIAVFQMDVHMSILEGSIGIFPRRLMVPRRRSLARAHRAGGQRHSDGHLTMFTPAELSDDGFLGGALRILQPRHGYRAATDAVLLAAACPAQPGDSVLDLGCGAGVASLCLGHRVPGLALHGLERQPAYADLARRNAARNAIALDVTEGDLLADASRPAASRSST